MTKKILVTGSREFTDVEVMREALIAEVPEGERVIVIHGCARGADSIADKLATDSPIATVVKVPADWDHVPRYEAGPLRNGHMLDLNPDVVLAFLQTGAKNAGTKNCIKQADERGIQVKVFFG
jgi:hypothetical protein